jgi:nucleotide-binding universal stress UspA family protein
MKAILVPIDFTASTLAVLRAAEDLARAAPARIILLHVTRPPVVLTEEAALLESLGHRDRDEAAKKLAAYRARLADEGFAAETVERDGPAVDCILEEAERARADCVVMGSHGHTAIYELFVGSTTSGVINRARCPVLVVPPPRG